MKGLKLLQIPEVDATFSFEAVETLELIMQLPKAIRFDIQ